MWARVLRLLGIVAVSVFLGYLIGSSGMVPGVAVLLRSPATSPFIVSDLSIQPAEVQPNEIVTITVSVANTHDTWGIYSLVLKINGVKEAQKQATLNASSSQDVSFSVRRGNPGRYTVFINGKSGSFTVVAATLGREKRQKMPACELLSTCPYFNDTMYEMAKTDKERYCKGAYSWCGRHMTFKSLERELKRENFPQIGGNYKTENKGF